MFLNYIKRFLVKKSLNYGWKNLRKNVAITRVQTVGIVVDAAAKIKDSELLNFIFSQGIEVKNCSLLVFEGEGRVDNKNIQNRFSPKDFAWNGIIQTTIVKDFCEKEFDLLINYYENANPFLMKVTQQSKALFKVGFDGVERRLNHFLIQSAVSKPKVFFTELFKFLNLLNKI